MPILPFQDHLLAMSGIEDTVGSFALRAQHSVADYRAVGLNEKKR